MSNIIKIAFHVPTQKFIHIDNASNGLSCSCECLKCNERLEAIQGEVRTKHFRHHTNLNCEGSRETALHELGKQILVDNNEIAIPKHGIIKYVNAVAEKRLEAKRPDVSATFDGQEIFFEIFVSHAIDNDKEKFFIDKKYRSVEINLSDSTASSFEEIKKLVLDETINKKVIFWTDETLMDTEKQEVKQSDNSWVGQLLAGVLGILVLIGLFTKKRGK